ncbi:Telomerase reverse transcriptase [Exophiala oligosperma]
MNEIVDFVVWSLFRGTFRGLRPRHILCHGLQRASALAESVEPENRGVLPGIVRHHPNDSISVLTSSPWTNILTLLGNDAEAIISTLFLDCGIFTKLSGGNGNYYQLSGTPLSELKQIRAPSRSPKPSAIQDENVSRGTADIRFVRNRILYAKSSVNKAGKIKFGLHHTHVLERCSHSTQYSHGAHVAKYIFPRQFGLHNVFTSTTDLTETAQQFKDYTIREQEIRGLCSRAPTRLPRRLRGKTLELVKKIQHNHHRCSYTQLLRHYCSLGGSSDQASTGYGLEQHISSSEPFVTQVHAFSSITGSSLPTTVTNDSGNSFLPYSTHPSRVSAFCRTTITHLLPRDAFGIGADGRRNHQNIMMRVDEFVQMRRFESMTLHKVVQGLRVKSIPWLCPPGKEGSRLSKSDHSKRLELLYEFIYYVFDSLLIPLIRANFYVTESSAHRNRLFYFRQDAWRKLSEPSLTGLKVSMYSNIKPHQARQKLQGRTLGYSHIRLLPKDHGARPITNLRRRQWKIVSGRRILGTSINTQLSPLFSVLNYERGQDPAPLGSAMFSVADLHSRISKFQNANSQGSPLFFVKVDIQSCFDSIPQDQLLVIARRVLSNPLYRTTRHTEIKCLDGIGKNDCNSLRRRYIGSARSADDTAVFSELAANAVADRKRKVVFADTGNQRLVSKSAMLKLLYEHVGDNIVKMGKKHMRQIKGIPQGSVLSSLLCSYFFGAFERDELGFLKADSSMLLRLIDDFLLITSDAQIAKRFLEVMSGGNKKYGIVVNAEKSLVNFDVSINGHKIPRLSGERFFPYCGMGIDTKTLELQKHREKTDAYVNNTLTVETSSRPGTTLRRKVLASLKLQMHAMLLDMSLNSRKQVILTLLGNFTETAMKMHQYIVRMGRGVHSSQMFVRTLIEELVTVSTKICWVKNNCQRDITRAQMCWIAAAACEGVLSRKQSRYKDVLIWLRSLRESTEDQMKVERKVLSTLLEENKRTFHGYTY